MYAMAIGEDIKRLREERGLGVNQLGVLSGVAGSTISQWENGGRFPRKRELERVLDFLGAEVVVVPKGKAIRRQRHKASVSEVRALLMMLPYVSDDDRGRILQDITNTMTYNRLREKEEGRERGRGVV
jgi:transcriptional regulator with XRE-family HTH domain